MDLPARMRTRRGSGRAAIVLLVAALAAVAPGEASALITGGEGNAAHPDPGWPKGAAAVFNSPARVAWWEGPPFGGGQWHAECRGDARAFNPVLADFARIDAKTKRVVLHDGIGHSFWLNLNREPAKQDAARIDWVFMVWQPASWVRLRQLPADLNPTDPRDADQAPPVQLDVYTGGNLRWADVTVPPGLEVIDQRLEAHGFSAADGVVLEGQASDLATGRPVAARMRLERIEPQPTGGYRYTVAAEAEADDRGRWVLKKAPAGWHRVVVAAEGYVPRVVGHGQYDDQPRWQFYESALARPAPVSGRVADDAGRPLADVEVRLHDLAPAPGGRYELPEDPTVRTDAEGRFRAEQIPAGRATVWLAKPGYCRPGLGLAIEAPAEGLALTMIRSARLVVTVDFAGAARPAGYMVRIAPEGGEAVGKWSGAGDIDARNRIAFEEIPPGRYVVQGQPNPSSGDQKTEPVTLDLKGGDAPELTLRAR